MILLFNLLHDLLCRRSFSSYVFPNKIPFLARRSAFAVGAKWHKWGGLFFSCFLLPFLISGILLNHRYELRHLDVPRRWLPASYGLHNWNQGTVRGTLRLGADSVLLYGENGLFLSDDRCRQLRSWNDGLQVGAENQSFSDVVAYPMAKCLP